MRSALLLLALVATFVQPAAPTRVLFIGNSLTYANDLPGMVRTLARAAGERFDCESVAFPDFSLEDHWRKGDAQRAIARGGWQVVVLQQGPSALPESRVLLVAYTKRFDAEIKKVGARTALYMVWPSSARRGDFPGVSGSYVSAAESVQGSLLPVGDAWREAWRLNSRLPLYGPDGFHPSAMGSYLGALVIYEQITGRAAPAMPIIGAAAEDASLLQRAARTAIAAHASGK